jgi:hypothetical protein
MSRQQHADPPKLTVPRPYGRYGTDEQANQPPECRQLSIVGSGESDPSEPPVRTNPLGSGFTVSSTDPAIVRVDVSACRGNYEWSLQIDYSYHGKTLHKVIGPFKSFGAAGQNTAVYTPDPSTGNVGTPSPPADVPIGCRGQQ